MTSRVTVAEPLGVSAELCSFLHPPGSPRRTTARIMSDVPPAPMSEGSGDGSGTALSDVTPLASSLCAVPTTPVRTTLQLRSAKTVTARRSGRPSTSDGKRPRTTRQRASLSLPTTSEQAFHVLTLFAIQRRRALRTRKTPSSLRSRLGAVFSKSVYFKGTSVASPPGALPEHTVVWARLDQDMPESSVPETSPWHLAQVVYARPAPGYCLAYLHSDGDRESVDDYLIEWAAGFAAVKEKRSSVVVPASRPETRRRERVDYVESPPSGDELPLEVQQTQQRATPLSPSQYATESPQASLFTSERRYVQPLGPRPTVDAHRDAHNPDIYPPEVFPSRVVPETSKKRKVETFATHVACAPWHFQYYVHFQGYNRRYDRWCSMRDVLPATLYPTTATPSRKALARHLVSALHTLPHPLVVACQQQQAHASPSSQVGSVSNHTPAREDSSAQHACAAATLVLLRIVLAPFMSWEKGDTSCLQDLADDLDTPAAHRACMKFLLWCVAFFRRPTHRSKSLHHAPLQTPYQLSQLWWCHTFLAYFQLDLLDSLAAANANSKKKRKANAGSSAATNGLLAYLAGVCPSNDTLNALLGNATLSEETFQAALAHATTPTAASVLHSAPDLSSVNGSVLDTSTTRRSTELLGLGAQSSSATSGNQRSSGSTISSLSGDACTSMGTAATTGSVELYGFPDLGKYLRSTALPHVPDDVRQQLDLLVSAVITRSVRRTTECERDARTKGGSGAPPPHPQQSGGDGEKPSLPASVHCRNCSGVDSYYDVVSDPGEHEGMDRASVEAHEATTKLRTIDRLYINDFIVPTWYYSPFPLACHPLETLYVCGGCLEFFRKEAELRRHELLCSSFTPPGDEIYRDGRLSFFEVDGETEWQYCENLSLISKLFLDHKTLQYSVAPFLFYVLIEWDDTPSTTPPCSPLLRKAGLTPARNNQVVGYFSKEKYSTMGYNLACILTLPQGYGKYFIHFSYSLSKIEKKYGTPERPLSDLGRVSYTQYWKQILSDFLLSPADCPPVCGCFFSEIASTLSTGLCTPTTCPLHAKLTNDRRNKTDDDNDSAALSCQTSEQSLCLGQLPLSIDDVAHFTSIRPEDIVSTLKSMGALYIDEKTNERVIQFDRERLLHISRSCGRIPPPILPEFFVWCPNIASSPLSGDETTSPTYETISHRRCGRITPRRFHFSNHDMCPHHFSP